MVLVTGASGFVGKAVVQRLLADNKLHRVSVALRRKGQTWSDQVSQHLIGDMDATTNWSAALKDVSIVIHCAARVHVMVDRVADPLVEFNRINVQGSLNLAQQAAAAGVKRLVYVSSIKVNGEETVNNHPYSELDIPAPQDPYGVSKWEAEQTLWRVAQETGLEVVIVRPPLVYGAGVKGNFAQMMRVVARGIPLPLGSVHNQRNLIYVGNLVDALITCATHPAATGQTYLVSDGEEVSTPDLLGRLANAMGVSSRVFPFPLNFLKLAGKITGKSRQVERLLGSLQVDNGKIRRELSWIPPYTLQEGLEKTAAPALQK